MLRVHTTSDRQSAVRLKPAVSAEGKKMFLSLPEGLSACRAQDDALRSSPVVTKRQSPMSSLRARATAALNWAVLVRQSYCTSPKYGIPILFRCVSPLSSCVLRLATSPRSVRC